MNIFPKLSLHIVDIPRLWGTWAGITLYPFIFIIEAYSGDAKMIAHEKIHIGQQEPMWQKYGPIGLLVWYTRYLCSQSFRVTVETEAYSKGSGYTQAMIDQILKDHYMVR